MSMKKLPVEVQSLLSSSLQINSYKRVVEELVYNSLDAGAISIAIRVDIEENKIQVIDNGQGITEKDFNVLGQRHMTSKCVDLNTLKSLPNTYGFRGQSLANIITISEKVKITSRSENGEDTWLKIFYNSKLRELAKTTTRPSVGTTVEITGLFYNLHIQNKAVNALGELNDIKTYLKRLSLVHTNISLSLRNDSKNEIIFQTHKNRNVYQTLKLLFDVDNSDIQEFQIDKNLYKVTAYIGKKDKEISKHHWIYLNMKYLSKSKLHKIVNDALKKSLKIVHNRKVKTKIADNEEVYLTKCSIPFYIIFISCPYYDYDIGEVSKQTTIEFRNWQDITKLLEKLIKFCTGDENLIRQLKPKSITQSERKTKVQIDDTRDKVRKIVEKLLKSGTKQLGVSQMQNGVKGKVTKRKIKKRPNNISISKVIPPKNCSKLKPVNQHVISSGSNHDNEVKLHKNTSNINNVLKKTNSEKQEARIISPEKEINEDCAELSLELNKKKTQKSSNNKSLKNNIKAINKQNKTKMPVPVPIISKSIEENGKKKKSKLIMNPREITPSCGSYNNKLQRYFNIENRHKKVAEKFTNVMNFRHKKNHEISVHEMIKYSDDISSNKKVSVRKRIEEIIVYDYIPHPLNPASYDYYKQKQYNYNVKLGKETFVSSHDLLKTILNSQFYKTHPRNIIEDTAIHNKKFEPRYCEPSIKFSNQLSNNVFMTRLTYESHNYNKQHIVQNTNVYKHNMKRQFLTKQSRENFLGPVNKPNSKTLNRDKFKSKVKNVLNDKKFKFYFDTGFKVDNNYYLQESAYLIEFSESNGTNKDRKKIDKKSIVSPRFSLNTRRSPNDLSNIDQNAVINSNELRTENTTKPKVGNTYTISDHDVSCISKVIDSHYFEKDNFDHSGYNVQATYTINKNANHNIKNVSDYFVDERNGLNVVFLSKLQLSQDKVNNSYENIDPLNVCDTILSNSNGIKDDQINYNIISSINLNDSLFNFENDVLNNDTNKNTLIHIHNSDEIENTQDLHQEINPTNNNTNTIKSNTQAVNIEQMEPNNRTNIIHKDTDIDYATIDKEEDALNIFNMKTRLNFIPKGMSQIFENCNTKTACEYSFHKEYFENILYNDFANNVRNNTDIFEPRVKNVIEISDKIEKVNTKLHKENASLTFDGKSLERAKVLGQIDGKFIAATITQSNSSRYLVLFDQHAVHERIRLEKNLSDYLHENEWNSISLDNIIIKLSRDEILYLHNYKEKFAEFGLQWDILNNNEISVNAIPEAILGKNPRQVDKIIKAVKNLILEEIDILKTQRGCISLHPKSIMELVFSEACRYAIKFGDKLSIDECVDLLHSLSKCKTPFQCAHGRPVMAVILDIITADNINDYKVNISNVLALHKKLRK